MALSALEKPLSKPKASGRHHKQHHSANAPSALAVHAPCDLLRLVRQPSHQVRQQVVKVMGCQVDVPELNNLIRGCGWGVGWRV